MRDVQANLRRAPSFLSRRVPRTAEPYVVDMEFGRSAVTTVCGSLNKGRTKPELRAQRITCWGATIIVAVPPIRDPFPHISGHVMNAERTNSRWVRPTGRDLPRELPMTAPLLLDVAEALDQAADQKLGFCGSRCRPRLRGKRRWPARKYQHTTAGPTERAGTVRQLGRGGLLPRQHVSTLHLSTVVCSPVSYTDAGGGLGIS